MNLGLKKYGFILFMAITFGLANACARIQMNASSVPVRAANPRPDSPVKHPDPRAKYKIESMSPSFVTVQKGDTVYALSRRHNVPTRSLIEINRLKAPFILQKGQRIQLPPPSIHTVQKGETIYSISRRYSVDMSLLARQNNLAQPYSIFPGQYLKLPGSIVEPQERWIASQTKAPAKKGASTAKSTSTAKKTTDKKTATTGKGGPQKKTATRKSSVRLPDPPSRTKGKFAWPVKGTVMTNFGAAGAGRHNDGINIKVAEGASVLAAENGVVAYAGNELKGFGNLLLVKHADGWMTAYAHNKEFLVKRGDTVKRGQPMAKAGKTGNAKEPQLHFEIRRGTKAVDPMAYLESK